MSEVRRLFVLLCGYEFLRKTVSTRDVGGRFILAEPICAYLLDTERGWVLLDTGIDPAYARDPVLREKHFLSRGWTPPMVYEEHELERQLAGIDIGIPDIAHVILSHLHFDHCDRLGRFAHAPISVQRREYEGAIAPDRDPGYLPRDYAAAGLDWDLRDGDWEALPGLSLIDTRGHTPGHQSAVVTFASGRRIVLPFDAGDLAENFDVPIAPGSAVDPDAAMAAIARINDIRSRLGAAMLLFHDPVAIQSMRLAPAFYD